VSLPEAPIWLHADPMRLVQVVVNLLSNASKYTHRGGRIELAATADDDNVIITLRDNGVGIDGRLLPRVFELFTQGSRSLDRSQGGLGIGLTLVRNLVEMHGGAVSAESEGSGRGSLFTVRLPAGEPPEQHRLETPATAAAKAPQRRILIVEDNTDTANMLAMLFQKLGDHQARTANDGASAASVVAEFQPDIVLLDIGLPGIDGYEVARRLRTDLHFGGLLVALTGYGRDGDRQKSKESGFDLHMVKPPDLADLKQLLVHPKLPG
jgi:CheY-like chemotaxis protein/anti-sigma regulatory factor (Ser/Thr protein kinase)